jgi:hypothetical protein
MDPHLLYAKDEKYPREKRNNKCCVCVCQSEKEGGKEAGEIMQKKKEQRRGEILHVQCPLMVVSNKVAVELFSIFMYVGVAEVG